MFHARGEGGGDPVTGGTELKGKKRLVAAAQGGAGAEFRVESGHPVEDVTGECHVRADECVRPLLVEHRGVGHPGMVQLLHPRAAQFRGEVDAPGHGVRRAVEDRPRHALDPIGGHPDVVVREQQNFSPRFGHAGVERVRLAAPWLVQHAQGQAGNGGEIRLQRPAGVLGTAAVHHDQLPAQALRQPGLSDRLQRGQQVRRALERAKDDRERQGSGFHGAGNVVPGAGSFRRRKTTVFTVLAKSS